jgi:hypothetical protein
MSISFFCPCLVFVLWSFVLSFDYPSLEISVSLCRSVNLVLLFLNSENGYFLIPMRDIVTYPPAAQKLM